MLQRALKCHEIEIAEILLTAGADPNVAIAVRASDSPCCGSEFHPPGFTCKCQLVGEHSPIALAASSETCVDLIPKLLEHGATIPRCNVLLNAIVHGASVATVSSLMEEGENPNQCRLQTNSEETTPLPATAARCSTETVALLLEADANPDDPLRAEFYPLYERYGLGFWKSPPLVCNPYRFMASRKKPSLNSSIITQPWRRPKFIAIGVL